MDLDLFDVFDEDDSSTSTTGKKPNARISSHELVHEANDSTQQSALKRPRKEESQSHVDEPEILTKETTSTTESGIILKKISAIPVDYKPAEKNINSLNSTPSEPAKVYPFKLDPFQAEAISYIEKEESVLVAAHTSAGKTAVAEYAIAKSLKNGQRVIYTSPIKALSNQKYRDLEEEFGDVGLMTGDMTINPSATCLIMTTEILRNMLYRGSEVMREVAWVIYDEVHYMRDKERGVVWEESIILLPHKVRFVFLSATIPNAKEFVGWVAKTHHQPCHVVYTDYRPVPLQHFVFPSGAEGLFLVVDEKSKFREDNFQKAMALLHTSGEGNEVAKKGGNRRKSGGGAKNTQSTELFKIVRLIMERQLDPCIVFSFSKRDCETYATQMSRLDFNNSDEKELVEQVFSNAMEALSEDDQTLPQVQTLLPLLKRGIGIHHGGLLPILKEVIEILFQEGLIKCLFATETFSIGINMPAKTVVFTNTRKYDGKDFRWITSGEYIQMSGRAGRRGKDDRGIVIQMLDESMEPDVAKGMLYGDPDALYSSYHLGYNMVLNMLRVEDADPENILRASFHQYQQEQQSPEFEQQADELQRSAVAMTIPEEGAVAEYFAWCRQLEKTQHELMTIILNPKYCLPFFQTGRLVSVGSLLNPEHNWGWGIVVQCRKADSKVTTMSDIVADIIGADESDTAPAAEYVLDVLLEVRPLSPDECANSTANTDALCKIYGIKGLRPVVHGTKPSGTRPVMIVLQVALHAITSISAVRLNIPRDLRKEQARANSLKAIQEVRRRFSPNGSTDGSLIPLLDPVDDLGIVDEVFTELSKRCTEMRTRLADCAFHRLPAELSISRLEPDGGATAAGAVEDEGAVISLSRSEWLLEYEKKVQLLEEARKFRQLSRESQAVSMRDELKKMRRVLRRSGFITADGVLETKGRFSCELSTADELVVTDMVFDGVFNELTVEQTVSLLSCFVHSEASKEGAANIRPDLQKIYTQLQVVARKIAKVRIDAKIAVDEDEYVKSFNPELMEVCYAWCAGAKFSEVCRLTEVFEGSIIRVIRRLEELLRQLASASMAIGNTELKARFEEGADKIRRGVVFTASLYL